MSQFAGYNQAQWYRVAQSGGASESMTLDEARVLQARKPGSWIEEWNGWEWVKI